MPKTMLIKPELLVKDMTLIGPDNEQYRVVKVESAHGATGELVVTMKAKNRSYLPNAAMRFAMHSHEYARINARIPAHVRGAVLAKAGVTGEYHYAQRLEDKPVRYRFAWIPRTAMRFGGYGDWALTYGQLRNMSDFALTDGVPQD